MRKEEGMLLKADHIGCYTLLAFLAIGTESIDQSPINSEAYI